MKSEKEILPHQDEDSRKRLILIEETNRLFEDLGYLIKNKDTKLTVDKLTRHSKYEVLFKCPVCHQPKQLSYKRLLDGKGLSHEGECRKIYKSFGGKKGYQGISEEMHSKRIEASKQSIGQNKEEIVEKRKQTNRERYGVDHVQSTLEIRQKMSKGIREAYRKDNKALNKRKQTNLEKYGSTNYLQSPEGSRQTTEHSLKIHNTEYPFMNSDFQVKAREIYRQKSGYNNPTEDQLVRQKIIDTKIRNGDILVLSTGERLSDYCERHQVKPSNAYFIFAKYGEDLFIEYCQNGPQSSSLELYFINLLKEKIPSIKHFNQYPFGVKDLLPFKPDFKIVDNSREVYVNVDGLYWHSDLVAHKNYSNNYHQIMRSSFEKHNLRLMQFREDEVVNKSEIVKSMVLNAIGMSKLIGARTTKIMQLDSISSNMFFEENHLKGPGQSGTTFALVKDNMIYQAIKYSYSKSAKQLFIVRSASKIGYTVQGGFSKLLSHLEKINVDATSIVSFCDMRYATGSSYLSAGFQKVSESLGFEWTDLKETYNRRNCRANMDKRRLSENQQAEEFGWYKIYDAGQVKYLKNFKD